LGLIGALLYLATAVSAQPTNPVDPHGWKKIEVDLESQYRLSIEGKTFAPGQALNLVLEFKIQDEWYLEGPLSKNNPLRVIVAPDSSVELLGNPTGKAGKMVKDPTLGRVIEKHVGAVQFIQRFRIKPDTPAGNVEMNFKLKGQSCTKGSCRILRKLGTSYTVLIKGAVLELSAADTALLKARAPPTVTSDEEQQDAASFWEFMFLCFLGGLGMLLLPCVWPMIPITISIFVKHSETSQKSAAPYAIIYGLGIVGAFGAIGLAMGFWLPDNFAQKLATNGWVNLSIGVLFVAFALSFFGMFDLKVPDFVMRRLPTTSGSGGQGMIVTSLLMGLLFAVTSFACTAPIMGTILIAGAQSGNKWYVPLGIIGSAAGVAIPFVFLAMFPSALKKMPRSGGWMNTFKVVLGFIEMAAALKFLSNADMAWDFQILTWPLFMCMWIAIMLALTCYLFGWIRMPHDGPTETLSPVRVSFGMLFASFALYLVFGLFHPHEPMPSVVLAMTPPNDYGRPHLKNQAAYGPSGEQAMIWHEDWDQAKSTAAATGRPIFVDFTGVMCTNCRLVEKKIFPRVTAELRNYVLAKLTTDYGSRQDEYTDLRDSFGSRDLPFYVLLAPDGTTVLGKTAYTDSVSDFREFLQKGLQKSQALVPTSSTPVDPTTTKPAKDSELKWYHDLEEGKKAAKENGTRLFVDFGGTYCPPCKKMEATVFKEPEVVALFKKMTVVKLDTQAGDNWEANEATMIKITGTADQLPYYVVLDEKGEIVSKLTGKQPTDVFVKFLNEGLK